MPLPRVRPALITASLALALTAALAPAAWSKNDDRPHTWTVILQRGKEPRVNSAPGSDSPFPVFKRGRGDQIQFQARGERLWVRFRGPTPLRLKGEPVQRLEVHPVGLVPNPIYTFTTDSPPDNAEWERFTYEIFRASDMPKDTAEEGPEIHTDARQVPGRAEMKKKKLKIEQWIDAVK